MTATKGKIIRGAFMRAVVGTFVALVLADPARAVPDHVKCYKIKDSAPKTSVTVADGCKVKVPGKLVCVGSEKTNVAPAPPGAPAGDAARDFVCDSVRCPTTALPGQAFFDQFGSRTVLPSAAKYYCAPATVGTTTTTTTTTTTSMTTTTSPVPCGDTFPSCNGSCPSDQGCAFYYGGGCSCVTALQCADSIGCFSSCSGPGSPCPPGYGTCDCGPQPDPPCACVGPPCGSYCACPPGGACLP